MMTSRPTRKPLAACTLIMSLMAGGASSAPGLADAQGGGGLQTKATRTFLTPASCAPCHNQGLPPLPEYLGEPEGNRLVMLNEFQTWRTEDKHSHAFDALTGARGMNMGKLLGYKEPGGAAMRKECLSCHSTGFQTSDLQGGLPETRRTAVSKRAQGVGCASCHGMYKEWVGEHGLPGEPTDRWRQLSTQEKWRTYGMADLRNPATRARVCYSCHIGDSDEGKVVSHAMYAAGHPPLPGIELATFENAEPKHWWKPREVPLFADREKAKPYGVDLDSLADTKSVVVGGVVALRETLRLIASQAEVKPEAALWPDYAQFECYACHHDLSVPAGGAIANWRQKRDESGLRPDGKKAGTPGRPLPRLWSLRLARFAAEQAPGGGPGADGFDAAVDALWAEFDKAPFGNPAAVAGAARALETRAESILASLEAMKFGPDAPAKFIRSLASLPGKEYPDYDTARQIAWAIKSISNEMTPKPDEGSAVAKVIAELSSSLKLDPFEGKSEYAKLIKDSKQAGDLLSAALIKLSEGEYGKSRTTAANYNPDAFKQSLANLLGALSGPPAASPIGGGGGN